MHRIRVMVAGGLLVSGGGMAAVLNSTDRLEVVGREGAGVLEEAFEFQPDLILFEVHPEDDDEYRLLRKVRDLCIWTKILVFSPRPVKTDTVVKLLDICHGYLQGPLLPGFILKAVELACFSGYFFFLGSPKDVRFEAAVSGHAR